MLDELKKEVLEANLRLKRSGLVFHTWGNASGYDREAGLIVIKPSGVDYGELDESSMAVVDTRGNKVEGRFNPSSDTEAHLELYLNFPGVGGIVHTHSTFSTAWAQAGKSIPCLGTTHADYFCGPIPCTRLPSREETEKDYERNTGRIIVGHFRESRINCFDVPGVLVGGHGPFSWGETPSLAVRNAEVLENIAKMAFYTFGLARITAGIPGYLLDKHYLRKHGKKSYYGQKEKGKDDAGS